MGIITDPTEIVEGSSRYRAETLCTEDISVTPSDTNYYSPPLRRLWVGVAGDVEVQLKDSGSLTTYPNVPAGWFTPGPTIRVGNSTSASSIIGQW